MQEDTRTILMNLAARHIRTRGYAAFSYADLAHEAGITRASIHHHFRTKELLGLALVDSHMLAFGTELGAIEHRHTDPRARILAYAGLFRDGFAQGLLPLCGALAAERDALPPALAGRMRELFNLQLDWLTVTLEDATPLPRRAAILLLASLEGGAFLGWGLGDPATGPTAFVDALAALLPGD